MQRVIVIDDNEQLRNMLKVTLTRAGYDIRLAENGRVGLSLQRSHPADVVITDILMPEKEGLETIIQLRKEFPKLKIIAISGGGQLDPEGYLSMATRLGADFTFIKPIDNDELLAAIETEAQNDA